MHESCVAVSDRRRAQTIRLRRWSQYNGCQSRTVCFCRAVTEMEESFIQTFSELFHINRMTRQKGFLSLRWSYRSLLVWTRTFATPSQAQGPIFLTSSGETREAELPEVQLCESAGRKNRLKTEEGGGSQSDVDLPVYLPTYKALENLIVTTCPRDPCSCSTVIITQEIGH